MDSLRILALGLLICYHTLLVYNADAWRVKSEYAGRWADYLIATLTPWRMALVFFIGGIAARFMLDKMSGLRFLGDRAGKLLTAFAFAVVVIVPFQRYVRLDEAHLHRGDYFEYLVEQARFVVRSDGIWFPDFAHVWFLPYLFVYSAAAVVLFRLASPLCALLQRLVELTPIWILVLIAMAWFAFIEGWMLPTHPMTGVFIDDTSSHLKFAPLFLLGALIGKSPAFYARSMAARRNLWIAGASLFVANVAAFWIANHTAGGAPYLKAVARGAYGGDMVFAVYVFGQTVLNRRNALLTYLTDAVLPIYLMHQTVLIVVADKIVRRHWPLAAEAALLVGATGLIPLAIYHIFVRETPWLRVLFGLRPRLRVESTSMTHADPPEAPSRDGSNSKVAVLVAAYNSETTLKRSVQSALAQPEVAEVCIIDDASSDGTLALARALAAEDERVVVVAQPVNRGPSAARNAGLAATRAPWIAILDADDYMLPGRLSSLLARAGAVDFIADALIRVPQGAEPPPAHDGDSALHDLGFVDFVEGNLGLDRGPLDLGFIKPLARRAFFEQHGLRYQEHMRLGEDYELYARALALGARFVMTGPAGYISVERPGSLSLKHSEDDLMHLRDCDDAIARIRAYTRREQRALERHRVSVDCRLQWRRLITAVKTRNPRQALKTFHSPSVAAYLAARLGEQAWVRSLALVRGPAREALP
ncbi:MAG TPA: glycosyltransferase [Caulobacterales bacterium]|nr:glycosyltransferase [Caulobacterales bacterium]